MYVENALSPSQVHSVNITIEENLADVLVAPDMVSLAIGREGQNSRLAARLTGWRINIRDSASPEALQSEAMPDSSDGSQSDMDGDNQTNLDNLTSLTVPELRSLATDRGVSLSGMRRKADIVDAIHRAFSSAAAELGSVNTEGDD